MIRISRCAWVCALALLAVLLLASPLQAQTAFYEASAQLPDPETSGDQWVDKQCAPVPAETVPSTITGYYSQYLTGLQVQYNTSNTLNTCDFHGGLQTKEVPMVCDTPTGQNITTVTAYYDANFVYQLTFTYTGGPPCSVGDVGASTNNQAVSYPKAFVGYFAGYATNSAITAIQVYFYSEAGTEAVVAAGAGKR